MNLPEKFRPDTTLPEKPSEPNYHRPSMPKTWDEVRTLRELIGEMFSEADRKYIEGLENSATQCPYLSRVEEQGDAGFKFYYCGKGIPTTTAIAPDPFNPIIVSHVSVLELGLWCMGDYKKCCIYDGRLPPKAGSTPSEELTNINTETHLLGS